MAGKLLWGWDATNKVWIPLQVDANGYVKVDMSNINLDDLADVSVAAPADDDLFYYDDATGLWKSRKLVDADIPAAIARDTEVTSAISTHAALPSVHHTKYTDAEAEAVADAQIATHAALPTIHQDAPALISTHADLTTGVHGAPTGEDLLVAALRRSNFMPVPTAASWWTIIVGSGVFVQEPMRNYARPGVTANSSALGGAGFFGFNEGGQYSLTNWDKKLYLIFNYGRVFSDSEAIARIQIKTAWAEGALGAQGIGLKVLNYVLWGESYGTELGEVDLSVTVIDYEQNQIIIALDPGVSIKWYVNGVLKGTQSTAAKIPTGISAGVAYLVSSIANGATGGVNCYSTFMLGKIWQER